MSSEAFSLQSSLMLWALAALIVCLGAHVMLGWMRQAQEEWEWDFGRLRQVAISGATFGTALSVAIPLGLGGEALSYPIGYQPAWAVGLWLGAMVLVTLLALVPVWREESASATGAGILLGLLISALQVGWVLAVGFRPGVQWNVAFLGAGALVSAAGTGTAMAMAFPYGARARSYRYSWRIAAAGLVGLSFLAGFSLVLFAADLPSQIGSVYRYELPGGMLSLFGGALVPIVLALMTMDLETRRRQRRRQWRSRRRGEWGPSYGSGESASSTMDIEPSRFLMQSPGRAGMPTQRPAAPAAPASPAPAAEDGTP
ncbi:MAG: hypothetical protein JNL30_09955 [Rubrivivax sp.]|nr:hypothetical protein [Rubrivivax sp.]